MWYVHFKFLILIKIVDGQSSSKHFLTLPLLRFLSGMPYAFLMVTVPLLTIISVQARAIQPASGGPHWSKKNENLHSSCNKLLSCDGMYHTLICDGFDLCLNGQALKQFQDLDPNHTNKILWSTHWYSCYLSFVATAISTTLLRVHTCLGRWFMFMFVTTFSLEYSRYNQSGAILSHLSRSIQYYRTGCTIL